MYHGIQVTHIVATDKNNCIGKDNTIPWQCKADLQEFKRLTMGKVCIVGRKTFESLPPSKLPGRFIIVVSSNPNYDVSHWQHCRAYPFMSEAIHEAEQWITNCNYPPEICIIGGATIYEHTLPITDRIYMSKINTIVDGGDTFYPMHTLLANESVIPVLMKEYEPDGTTNQT